MNLKNELYNDNETKNELYIENEPKNKLKELRQIIPHFCHLKPECNNLNKKCSDFNDFCVHRNICLTRFILNYNNENNNEKKKYK